MNKICIFSAQYLPHMGGVENYTYNLARFLRKKGDQVVIVTSNTENLEGYEEIEGIEIYRMPCWNLLDGRYPFLKMNHEFSKLNKQLKKEKFDLVLVNTRFYPHSLYGAVFAKRKHTRCIMVEHGTGHMTLHNPLADFVEHMIEHGITIIDKWFCKEYYGVSEACLEWLKHFHITGTDTLYNAVDLDKIEKLQKEPVRDFKKEYNLPEDAVILSYTGRLLKEKGIYQLIDSVKKIREKKDNVYMFLAGDGPEEIEVKKQSEYGIFPLGRVDFQTIVSLLMQTDIFCLPSDSEGFSTAVLEAVSCKCCVLTTERGGTKELVVDGVCGKIIKENDTETVYRALWDLVNDEKGCKQMAENAYLHLKEKFTWDIVAEKVQLIAKETKEGKKSE